MKLLFLVAAVAAVWVVEAQHLCHNDHECGAVIHCEPHEEHYCDVRDGRCGCRDRHFVGKRQQHHCRDHAECDHGHCSANSEGFCDEHGICGCRDLPHCGNNRDCEHLQCGAHEEAFCDENHGCHCRDFAATNCRDDRECDHLAHCGNNQDPTCDQHGTCFCRDRLVG